MKLLALFLDTLKVKTAKLISGHMGILFLVMAKILSCFF